MKSLILLICSVSLVFAENSAQDLLDKYVQVVRAGDVQAASELIYGHEGDVAFTKSRLSLLRIKETEGFEIVSTKLISRPVWWSATRVVKGTLMEPNIEPVGMIELVYKTSLTEGEQKNLTAYGKEGNEYYITGMKRTDLHWDGESDQKLFYQITPKLNGIDIQDPSTYKVIVSYNASGVDLKTFGSSKKVLRGQYISRIELVEPLAQEGIEVVLSARSGKVTREIARSLPEVGQTVLYQKN